MRQVIPEIDPVDHFFPHSLRRKSKILSQTVFLRFRIWNLLAVVQASNKDVSKFLLLAHPDMLIFSGAFVLEFNIEVTPPLPIP
ncbi:MAG: hypothetical protein QM449_11035 [Synergistota bacterium]|nr:hypothetical protein [Synergistota bacterium]